MRYAELDGFLESVRELYAKGGPLQNAADRVTAVWGKARQGLPVDDVFRGLALTNWGETRIPHNRKYELPGRARLVAAVNDGVCIFLYAGDHEAVDRWLDRNRGMDFIAFSAPATMEDQSGLQRVVSPASDIAPATYLLDQLSGRYRERLLEGLPPELTNVFGNINARHTDDELENIVLRVEAAAQKVALLDTLLKLREGDIAGAKTCVDLYVHDQHVRSSAGEAGGKKEPLPNWLTVHTRMVVRAFVGTLARSHKWGSLYIISPWISSFNAEAGMSFDQMLKRLRDDDATAYVVTRPPKAEDKWHSAAIAQLIDTKKASIKLIDELHTKLYYATTAQQDFAMLGSANMTQQSLHNRELAMLVRASGAGRQLVKQLREEATMIYRSPGELICKHQLGRA